MKKILLVALMALCAASLSFAESMECEEKCQGNANCAEDCTIEKVSEQSSDVESALPILGRHSVRPNSTRPRDK